MKIVEILQILGALIGAFASIRAGIEKRIISHFKEKNANSSGSAIELTDLGKLKKMAFDNLTRSGIIKHASEVNYYYFDEEIFSLSRKKRIRRALIIVSVLVVVVLAFAL